ncbi:hypothetical protein DPX16_3368 [Anabarilius grahami]|uniref:Uncharacterized protein n=1 Tax=Anabarilius grahami TaxID=495550 RepID=A0A3N0XLD9_ANAGA|nr:hypothetical protein DPX16_3368 [Anabarilius grahami]
MDQTRPCAGLETRCPAFAVYASCQTLLGSFGWPVRFRLRELSLSTEPAADESPACRTLTLLIALPHEDGTTIGDVRFLAAVWLTIQTLETGRARSLSSPCISSIALGFQSVQ